MKQEFLEFYGQDGEDIKIEKTKFEVCPRCHGEGSHTNPAIDGHGISSNEFASDPEFAKSYFSGVYDIVCSECGGNRVIKVVDWSEIDESTQKAHEQYIQDEYNYREGCAYERRMGA